MKHYRMIGYAIEKDRQEWEQFRPNAILDLPDDLDPYDWANSNWPQVFSHWLVDFIQISKEGE